jgi:hypothetical protein
MTGLGLVVAVVGVAAGLGIAGCGDEPVVGQGRGVVVPWSDRTRLLPVEPSIWVREGRRGAPRCGSGQLWPGVASAQGATGSMAGGVSVTNRSGSDCTLRGRPRLVLLERGQSIPVDQHPLRHDPFGLTPPPHYPAVSLRPQQQAFVPFIWQNLCPPQPPPTQIRLTWPGVRITVPVRDMGVPRCDDPSSPSNLAVGRFQPEQAPPSPPPKQLPLRVTITAPHIALPGQRLVYTVTLTNYSRRVVVFDTCPTYWQGLSSEAAQADRVPRALVLNCGTTPRIAPGHHATYAMQFTGPATASPEANALVWQFEPTGGGGGGKTPLRIE